MRRARCALRCWLGLALWLLAGAASSAEPLTWHSDLSAAAEEARDSGRLLLVLHLSGDFTAGDARQRPLVVFESLALTDEPVRELVRERFVLAYRHIGPPAVFHVSNGPPPKPAAKKREEDFTLPQAHDEYAVTYLCLPDRRVVHFVPGFVTARELLAELQFADYLYDDFARFPAAEQDEAVRHAHLEKAPAKSRQKFETLASLKLDERAAPTAGELARSLNAARQIHDQRLGERLGRNWKAAEFPAVAAALSAHGSTQRGESHLVLAAHGLVDLESIERPAYTIWSGRRFWSESGRREEVAQSIAAVAGKGRPLMLVVEVDRPAEAGRNDPLAWPPKPSDVLPRLDQFDVVTLSLDELAVWMTDKGLGPIKHPAGQHVRYVVFNREGQLVAAVHERDRQSRLISIMNAASRTGETAVSSERVER